VLVDRAPEKLVDRIARIIDRHRQISTDAETGAVWSSRNLRAHKSR
jgi:hypothetical protein